MQYVIFYWFLNLKQTNKKTIKDITGTTGGIYMSMDRAWEQYFQESC